MNKWTLKEYIFANGKNICKTKANTIIHAKMNMQRKCGDGWKFIKISKIIFVDD